MTPARWAERRRADNPLYPYRWTAVYRDGTRLPQFSPAGRIPAAAIPLDRITSLELEAPGRPLCRIPSPPTPEAIILQSTVRVPIGGGTPTVTSFAGFRVGARFTGAVLLDSGTVVTVQGPWPVARQMI